MTRRVLLSLVAVAALAGAGALLLDRVVEPDRTDVGTADGTTAVAPGSTENRTPQAAFPDAIPRTDDGECSAPRTDPDRPAIDQTGEPTDGVEVTEVTVGDGDEGEVTFTAVVSAAPVVAASSGSRWVVIELLGVRRATDSVTVETPHARAEPTDVCDDSAAAYAFSFDAPITGLELVTLDETTVEILVHLA